MRVKSTNIYTDLLTEVVLHAKKFIHDTKLTSEQHVPLFYFGHIKATSQCSKETSGSSIGHNQRVDAWEWLYNNL